MLLSLAALVQLAAACAPHVAPETLLALARAESGLNPLAVHDNTTGQTYATGTAEEATALVIRLTGHSLDLGLLQVNITTLRRIGVSVRDAFDPCRSLAAGAEVLREAYRRSLPGHEPQRALRVALSRYNTGDPARGFGNGYVRRVERAAAVRSPVPLVRPGRAARGRMEDVRVFRGRTDSPAMSP